VVSLGWPYTCLHPPALTIPSLSAKLAYPALRFCSIRCVYRSCYAFAFAQRNAVCCCFSALLSDRVAFRMRRLQFCTDLFLPFCLGPSGRCTVALRLPSAPCALLPSTGCAADRTLTLLAGLPAAWVGLGCCALWTRCSCCCAPAFYWRVLLVLPALVQFFCLRTMPCYLYLPARGTPCCARRRRDMLVAALCWLVSFFLWNLLRVQRVLHAPAPALLPAASTKTYLCRWILLGAGVSRRACWRHRRTAAAPAAGSPLDQTFALQTGMRIFAPGSAACHWTSVLVLAAFLCYRGGRRAGAEQNASLLPRTAAGYLPRSRAACVRTAPHALRHRAAAAPRMAALPRRCLQPLRCSITTTTDFRCALLLMCCGSLLLITCAADRSLIRSAASAILYSSAGRCSHTRW